MSPATERKLLDAVRAPSVITTRPPAPATATKGAAPGLLTPRRALQA